MKIADGKLNGGRRVASSRKSPPSRQTRASLASAAHAVGAEYRAKVTKAAEVAKGMDAFVLEHATDPFFSARPAGRGRGLGLSRARRLIEHNGGSLRLESQPGVGTTVHLCVPIVPEM